MAVGTAARDRVERLDRIWQERPGFTGWLTTTPSPTTVRQRPYLVTNRPATAADTADPSAKDVTASPDCRGVYPSPLWKYSANTSQIPVKPTKYTRPTKAPAR